MKEIVSLLKKSINSKEVKEQLKWEINEIDRLGFKLTQNIIKKLIEK